MEHTLGETHGRMKVAPFVSLNPCFNGTYSRRHHGHCEIMGIAKSLNPCFNGTYSRRPAGVAPEVEDAVLILVLMEHTLGVR